jgi:hypothetical protein
VKREAAARSGPARRGLHAGAVRGPLRPTGPRPYCLPSRAACRSAAFRYAKYWSKR